VHVQNIVFTVFIDLIIGMKCYPIISTNKLVDDSVELEYHVQDNYNLEIYDKWIMIYDVIMNKVYS